MNGSNRTLSRRERLEKGVREKSIFKGVIEGCRVEGGIIILEIRDDRGILWPVPGDNGGTVRLLDRVFGGVIDVAHTINPLPFIGKEVYYEVDEVVGALISLIPVDDPELEE